MTFVDETRVLLRYNLPTSEVVTDFYDQLKSLSSGYARCQTIFTVTFVEQPESCFWSNTCICTVLCFQPVSYHNMLTYTLRSFFSFDYEESEYREAPIRKACQTTSCAAYSFVAG